MMEDQLEVKEAIENTRFEIVLKNVRIESNTESASLSQKKVFENMPQLNLLSLTGCSLQNISPSIKSCSNLISLVLPQNELSQLPDVFDCLPKLKFIDLSHNSLNSLPPSLSACENLESLILNNNTLNETSFPDMSSLSNLHVFDASYNNLSEIPASLTSKTMSAKLHTVLLSHNVINKIPNSMSNLKQLKDFKMDGNKLEDVPTVIGLLPKLKVLDLSNNTFTESRFQKLANDKRAKLSAVVALARKVGKPIQDSEEKLEVTDAKIEPNISSECSGLTVRTGIENLTVRRHPSVSEIRPNLVCCVFNNVDLNGDAFKKFIALQTKLHASAFCENRTLSVIGTHRFNSFQLPLCYMALPKEDLYIRALNKKSSVSASELLDNLLRDAELARKRSKRNTIDPLHRYLHIVKDDHTLACLVDSQQIVISFPPITNSDTTKLTVETTSIWVEVSSKQSLEACKKTMDELVVSSRAIFPSLSLDQVRVVENDTLVSIYPDKNDLPGITVDRICQ
uniref:B3_4 domain-containing protein n=1 Tax=Caenorhabditis tropicalis TaxID=1561998 RepID=A0A1I7UKY7_9PELO